MVEKSRKFQAPKGMRDFYPADMAVRRHIESVWRQVSINHGFEEVEGPTFENIELYTHKSGPGIVSEIFSVYSGKDEKQREAIRAGSEAPFALRPEFTPTLARMVASRATELPKPIKWFSIPLHYRAERHQRGRLREFVQWNVDFIGGDVDPAKADAEVIATAVAAMENLGLSESQVTVKVSSRESLIRYFQQCDIPDDRYEEAFDLLDRSSRLPTDDVLQRATDLGLPSEFVSLFTSHLVTSTSGEDRRANRSATTIAALSQLAQSTAVIGELETLGLNNWYQFDATIVRGLAYYTGTVFEIIAEGERAIAGGGRYDNLIESFGGPPMPACGFGMGDVVLGILLHEKGLLPEDVYMRELRPHAFVISSGDEKAEAEQPRLVAELRRAGYHVRHTYRSTRNVGKLLGEAGKQRASTAIILDNKLEENLVSIKDLESGEQREVPRDQIDSALREILAHHHDAHV